MGLDSLRAIEEAGVERSAFDPFREDFPRGAMLADLLEERDLFTSSILDHYRFRSPGRELIRALAESYQS